MLVLFLHNNYGTWEFPEYRNLVGADWMENLRWADTEPSMHFRETNMDLSMCLKKANTDPSMHFMKANTKFLLPTSFSQWNLQEKTDTLECLHQAVTHLSTNIAKPSLTS